MKLTFLGHSAFKMERKGFVLILDPYQKGSVPGLKPLKEKANQVICSHKHEDHFGFSEIKPLLNRADTPFMYNPIATFHDEEQGSLRGTNNIAVIDLFDHKAVHLGDLGCMLEDEDIERIKDCDLLMAPVGGFFTLEPDKMADLVKKINPKIIVPMHYKGDGFDYDMLAPVEEFLDCMEDAGYPVNVYGSEFEIDFDTPRQIAVMSPLYKE